MLRRLGCIVLAGAAALVLLIGGNFYWGWTASGPAPEELSVVIPAGSSLASAAQVLEEKGAISSAGAFLNRAKVFGGSDPINEKLMAEKLLTGDVPVPEEGTILPESYSFERGEKRIAVMLRMQKAMQDTIAELWPNRSPDTVAKTPQEAVTLAAIVEKETGKASERRMIAGVYSNRIRKGRMLQADPTIISPITRGKPLGRRIRQSAISAV